MWFLHFAADNIYRGFFCLILKMRETIPSFFEGSQVRIECLDYQLVISLSYRYVYMYPRLTATDFTPCVSGYVYYECLSIDVSVVLIGPLRWPSLIKVFVINGYINSRYFCFFSAAPSYRGNARKSREQSDSEWHNDCFWWQCANNFNVHCSFFGLQPAPPCPSGGHDWSPGGSVGHS